MIWFVFCFFDNLFFTRSGTVNNANKRIARRLSVIQELASIPGGGFDEMNDPAQPTSSGITMTRMSVIAKQGRVSHEHCIIADL